MQDMLDFKVALRENVARNRTVLICRTAFELQKRSTVRAEPRIK